MRWSSTSSMLAWAALLVLLCSLPAFSSAVSSDAHLSPLSEDVLHDIEHTLNGDDAMTVLKKRVKAEKRSVDPKILGPGDQIKAPVPTPKSNADPSLPENAPAPTPAVVPAASGSATLLRTTAAASSTPAEPAPSSPVTSAPPPQETHYDWGPEVNSHIKNQTATTDDHRVTLMEGIPKTQDSFAGLMPFSPSRKPSCTHNTFYWFFEALNGNTSAPMILWLQGGPGCAVFFGLFDQVGPLRVNYDFKVSGGKNTWNQNYAMLFVDNPVGTGFSHTSDWNECVARSTEDSSRDLFDFLYLFYQKYPKYAKRDLYIAGPSYAGKFVPGLAYAIVRTKDPKLHVEGIAVGDGLTDPLVQTKTQADSAYGFGLINSRQRDKAKLLENKIVEYASKGDWGAARYLRVRLFDYLTNAAGGIKAYNVAVHADHARPLHGAWSAFQFFKTNDNKRIIHLEKQHIFRTCHMRGKHRPLSKRPLLDDIMRPVTHLIPILLQHMRVMYYEGQFDLRDGPAQVYKWMETMDWPGKTQFFDSIRRPWYVNHKLGGFARSYQNLTDVVVVGAGHLVPFDQPARAFEMITRFVENRPWHDEVDQAKAHKKKKGKHRKAPKEISHTVAEDIHEKLKKILGPENPVANAAKAAKLHTSVSGKVAKVGKLGKRHQHVDASVAKMVAASLYSNWE